MGVDLARELARHPRFRWQVGMLLTDGVVVAYLVVTVEDDDLVLLVQGLDDVPRFWSWSDIRERLSLVLADDGTAGMLLASLRGNTVSATWAPMGWDVIVYAEDNAGYRVEHRVLNAADYGAPTARRRLFLVARCDGLPIRWPEPTHGPGRAQPWRTAAECIDWSIPCPSIFDRERPLAEATQRRIAEGIRRYVLTAARPFIVCLTHGGRCEDVDSPLRTTTCANRGERALVAPTLVQTGYGERIGQRPRALDIEAPLGTVVDGQKHALVSAFLAKHYGGMVGQSLDRTLGTVTAIDHHSLVTAALVGCGGRAGQSPPTSPASPMPTTTTKADRGVVTATLGSGDEAGARRVAAFLTKFYGTGGQWSRLDEPMHTIPTLDRMGLVTVDLDGEPYVITDIGFRMLQPRELARAQGFDDAYILTGSKREQVARIGNSVCPPVARAVVAAQFPGMAPEQRAQEVA